MAPPGNRTGGFPAPAGLDIILILIGIGIGNGQVLLTGIRSQLLIG